MAQSRYSALYGEKVANFRDPMIIIGYSITSIKPVKTLARHTCHIV